MCAGRSSLYIFQVVIILLFPMFLVELSISINRRRRNDDDDCSQTPSDRKQITSRTFEYYLQLRMWSSSNVQVPFSTWNSTCLKRHLNCAKQKDERVKCVAHSNDGRTLCLAQLITFLKYQWIIKKKRGAG